MALLFVYLCIALFISFTCSLMEAVLLTTPLTYAAVKEEEGSKSAKLFSKLKQNIDRPITAILTLNTIAHTIGAAGGSCRRSTDARGSKIAESRRGSFSDELPKF